MATKGDQSQQYRRKPRIVFVGEDDSCQTQMAEGYMRTLAADLVEAKSAGMRSSPLDRRTIDVMKEDDVDIKSQQAKLISADILTWADLVVTICDDESKLNVGVPSSAHHKHWSVTCTVNPSNPGDLDQYRKARDEIKRRVGKMINSIKLFKA